MMFLSSMEKLSWNFDLDFFGVDFSSVVERVFDNLQS